MGDSGKPHGSNYAVFDNWIHEPCYLMGVLAGTMTKTGRIGMVGGHAIGEVNRLFHAFMAGARSVNPDRSEEHTSELQSIIRNSYAVFCLKKKKLNNSKL